jgi:hypothetical protein
MTKNQRNNCIVVLSFCMTAISLLLMSPMMTMVEGFSTAAATTRSTITSLAARPRDDQIPRINKMTADRRKKLGIADNEDEYDLEMALDNNTDPIITKIIAGSLIVSIMALLIYGIVIPATTDYGDGVCNPLLTSGRC